MALTMNHNLMAFTAAGNFTAQYARLGMSTRRLATGLRINTAADDAAGLAIRELQRANISALRQGARNANDAISMIQVADGALQVIDEKLIRMKELAEQAATGTYDSTQRLMIHSEFQAMAAEIDRIANATEFNGIHLLNGSLAGGHNGSGMDSAGAMKIHFGTGNDSAEDYYYAEVGDATMEGFGFTVPRIFGVDPLNFRLVNGAPFKNFSSGLRSFGFIPAGTLNISIDLDSFGADDDIQIFTTSGVHLSGTKLTDATWTRNGVTAANINNKFMYEENGFLPGAAYVDAVTNSSGGTVAYNGMNITYSGDGDVNNDGNVNGAETTLENLTIDKTTEDIVILISGSGVFDVKARWDYMPETIDIRTQARAQVATSSIDRAIIAKDKIRAHLGALQNRLENTVSNLNIQAENLQAAESRISDTDVATEMTTFGKNHILSQASVAMLAQANSLPKMALELIHGT